MSYETNKPEPLMPIRELGSVCPVCGKKSYSSAGVHPQCSMQLADAPRQAALALKKKQVQAASDAAKLIEATKPTSKFVQLDRPKRKPK